MCTCPLYQHGLKKDLHMTSPFSNDSLFCCKLGKKLVVCVLIANTHLCHLINFLLNLAASNFAPDFTIISAGFDAARGDPLGGCDVRSDTGLELISLLH